MGGVYYYYLGKAGGNYHWDMAWYGYVQYCSISLLKLFLSLVIMIVYILILNHNDHKNVEVYKPTFLYQKVLAPVMIGGPLGFWFSCQQLPNSRFRDSRSKPFFHPPFLPSTT